MNKCPTSLDPTHLHHTSLLPPPSRRKNGVPIYIHNHVLRVCPRILWNVCWHYYSPDTLSLSFPNKPKSWSGRLHFMSAITPYYLMAVQIKQDSKKPFPPSFYRALDQGQVTGHWLSFSWSVFWDNFPRSGYTWIQASKQRRDPPWTTGSKSVVNLTESSRSASAWLV